MICPSSPFRRTISSSSSRLAECNSAVRARTRLSKSFLAHNFNDRLAADFFGRPAKHLGVGATDESEAEIASGASQHERRAIDNRFQFGLLRAQRFFRRFAFAQINDGGLIEQCAV